MDKTLLGLLTLCLVLIGLGAPMATLTLGVIVALVVFSTWGSWLFLQGFDQSQPQPQPERIWD